MLQSPLPCKLNQVRYSLNNIANTFHIATFCKSANEQLVKQKNTIKTKRIAAMSKPKKAAKQLDEAQLKEVTMTKPCV